MKNTTFDLGVVLLIACAILAILFNYFMIGWVSAHYELLAKGEGGTGKTFNIKGYENDVYTSLVTFIYNGFVSLKSFNPIKIISLQKVSSEQYQITKDEVIFQLIAVFFNYLYITVVTAFFINLFAQSKTHKKSK